ncbi:unnamed protein product [Moneuplotes crassus]|uniref:Uncharacterized protein n=1 Tax=Euplotes crassus TaxID=5936 RepID=A0AAD2D7H9_EUPCR|nr:unnamed protein product [Moneuplotes crassus]
MNTGHNRMYSFSTHGKIKRDNSRLSFLPTMGSTTSKATFDRSSTGKTNPQSQLSNLNSFSERNLAWSLTFDSSVIQARIKRDEHRMLRRIELGSFSESFKSNKTMKKKSKYKVQLFGKINLDTLKNSRSMKLSLNGSPTIKNMNPNMRNKINPDYKMPLKHDFQISNKLNMTLNSSKKPDSGLTSPTPSILIEDDIKNSASRQSDFVGSAKLPIPLPRKSGEFSSEDSSSEDSQKSEENKPLEIANANIREVKTPQILCKPLPGPSALIDANSNKSRTNKICSGKRNNSKNINVRLVQRTAPKYTFMRNQIIEEVSEVEEDPVEEKHKKLIRKCSLNLRKSMDSSGMNHQIIVSGICRSPTKHCFNHKKLIARKNRPTFSMKNSEEDKENSSVQEPSIEPSEIGENYINLNLRRSVGGIRRNTLGKMKNRNPSALAQMFHSIDSSSISVSKPMISKEKSKLKPLFILPKTTLNSPANSLSPLEDKNDSDLKTKIIKLRKRKERARQ